eukprot:TRINITY_DN577_c1_g4_i1.p1 TRINITY_DN577_c1_g4~~TRINITY_DN577_c1_g4_i1.p1  ORF type:complete len:181 (+),score=82.36 TRINITY_DN577_c1_g4_i1:64-606(+)
MYKRRFWKTESRTADDSDSGEGVDDGVSSSYGSDDSDTMDDVVDQGRDEESASDASGSQEAAAPEKKEKVQEMYECSACPEKPLFSEADVADHIKGKYHKKKVRALRREARTPEQIEALKAKSAAKKKAHFEKVKAARKARKRERDAIKYGDKKAASKEEGGADEEQKKKKKKKKDGKKK